MMSEADQSREISDREVKRVVKHGTNQVYEPVVFTAEVAEELGVPEDVAYEALDDCSYVNEKEERGRWSLDLVVSDRLSSPSP